MSRNGPRRPSCPSSQLRRVSRRLLVRRGKEPGAAPGTLVYTGEKKAEAVSARYIQFDSEILLEGDVSSTAELATRTESGLTTWLDLVGLHDIDYIRSMGEALGLHSLILEDVLNPSQRPKIEEYPDLVFIVLKMLSFDDGSGTLDVESVSLVVGSSYVVSIREGQASAIDAVRERLRRGKGRMRGRGPDYVAYAIIDAVVDEYFRVAERLGDEIEALEERVLTDADSPTLERIHSLKRELLVFRRSVWPLREVLVELCRWDSPLIDDRTQLYLRDVKDHTIQVIEIIETLRDLLNGIMDLYHSTLGNKMNEIMKVLTMIATLFIPLSFLAGLYGMNFRFMPELEWRWGYPALLLLMLTLAGGMIWFFRRRRWL